jgi:hypothetical protein
MVAIPWPGQKRGADATTRCFHQVEVRLQASEALVVGVAGTKIIYGNPETVIPQLLNIAI